MLAQASLLSHWQHRPLWLQKSRGGQPRLPRRRVNLARPAPVTWTATGSVSVTWTATGSVSVTWTATGSVPVTWTATGSVPVTWTATGSVSVTGMRSGTQRTLGRSRSGTATGPAT